VWAAARSFADYWSWREGWATDLDGLPVRQATPEQWAAYAALSGTDDTLLVVNQLTGNVSEAILGLHAHGAAGTRIRLVELGNEMYDDSRDDVRSAYPNGTVYAEKMATWASEIKHSFPDAKLALVAMTWRPDLSAHLAAWNHDVFVVTPDLAANVDAVTLHPYFGISWENPASVPNGSAAGVAPPPSPPSPSAVAAVLSAPFEYLAQNEKMLAATVPPRLELWVTEVAAYGAADLDFTWLKALVNVLFEVLLLLRMPAITAMTPYCVVCGDPIAPNFASVAALPVPASRAVVPPALANRVLWNTTVRGAAHAALFLPIQAARRIAEGGGLNATMHELAFAPNPPLQGSKFNASTLVGFALSSGAVGDGNKGATAAPNDGQVTSVFLLNLGSESVTVDLGPIFQADANLDLVSIFPRSLADAVSPAITLAGDGLTLGRTELVDFSVAQPLALPPLSITTGLVRIIGRPT
jgi:hypothetical protein